MKTLTYFSTKRIFGLLAFCLLFTFTGYSQTYTTRANGAWNLATTWQGGVVPPTGTIPSSAVINIRHIVTYSGLGIFNSGTINISNPGGVSPRLLLPSGIDVDNLPGGKIIVNNAELRQYRFVGGLETGSPNMGKLKNKGGSFTAVNSFVEIAQDWSNETNGVVVFRNSSLVLGGGFDNKSGRDSIENSSISLGMHGGNTHYNSDGVSFYNGARFQIASAGGKFEVKSGTVSGNIDYITLKNHVTGTTGSGIITINTSVTSMGLSLNSYCVAAPVNYIPNGKLSGSQTLNCALNYFPAGLISAQAPSSLNLSTNPVLISGVDRQVGARYKYEGVAPGMDAIVRIDSLVGGASIVVLDDNAAGSGFTEGFQPQIRSGNGKGKYYAVFSFAYNVAGTNTPTSMSRLSLTALDIDGSNTVKEFVEIGMGAGATAAYVAGTPGIAMTQTAPGTFRGINIDGNSVSGVDTSAKQYMFTVTNTNVSSFTLNMGMEQSTGSANTRLYSVYMKDFAYSESIPLPVKLESFTASLNSGKVKLNWKTAEEVNSSHFDVERSVDGKNYKSIGIVFSHGNSNAANYYSLPDNISSMADGVIYYRLKNVDIDGKFTYSDVRVIRKSNQANKAEAVVMAYPNPVLNDLRVTLPENWQGREVHFSFYSVGGSLVKSVRNAHAGQTEILQTNDLSKGIYILKVNMGNETAHQKIIKN